jgi:hypothetical protein
MSLNCDREIRACQSRAVLAASATYLRNQPDDITTQLRENLVDWMYEIQPKFRLSDAAVCLAISILDRFLSRRSITVSNIQLLACASLWIASKLFELFPATASDYRTVSDNVFTEVRLCQMEVLVLQVLDYQLFVSTPSNFLVLFQKTHFRELSVRSKEQATNLSDMLLLNSRQHYSLLVHSHEVLALSCVQIALEVLLLPCVVCPTDLRTGECKDAIKAAYELQAYCCIKKRYQNMGVVLPIFHKTNEC